MTSPALVSAFFDELTKIGTAGDLASPAVVSDSATVDGPPATPFTRRRNFKKLEEISHISKEAGLGKDFVAWARKAKHKAGRAAAKVEDAHRDLSIKTFMKLPKPVQKVVTSPAMMDPSDQRMNPITQLLKVGSTQKKTQHKG